MPKSADTTDAAAPPRGAVYRVIPGLNAFRAFGRFGVSLRTAPVNGSGFPQSAG